jgi:hypothetical protein
VMKSTSQANRKTHKKPGTLPKELWSSISHYFPSQLKKYLGYPREDPSVSLQ